jgi:histidine phosphotransferase ChpT
VPEEAIDAHAVQPYYTLLLAEEAGMEIVIDVSEEEIVFRAQKAEVEPAFQGDVPESDDGTVAADAGTLADD